MNDEYDNSGKPVEDWAMSDPDFHLKQKLKADDAEIPAATLYAPPDIFDDENFLEIEPGESSNESESDDWTIDAAENEITETPKEQVETDGWKMPEPVFKSSEGKTIRKADKKTTNPDLPAAQPVISEKSEFSDDAPPQPDVSDEFEASALKSPLPVQAAAEQKKDVEKPKMFFAFGGIFLMLIFATAFVIGIYFLFFHE